MAEQEEEVPDYMSDAFIQELESKSKRRDDGAGKLKRKRLPHCPPSLPPFLTISSFLSLLPFNFLFAFSNSFSDSFPFSASRSPLALAFLLHLSFPPFQDRLFRIRFQYLIL